MKRVTEILSGMLAVLVLLFALFFTVMSAAEYGHDCTGEDCPVCQILATARTLSKTLFAALSVAAAAVILPALLKAIQAGRTDFLEKTSLVSLKVKLSN